MPELINFNDFPFRSSIVQFDPKKEELFLICTLNRINGPSIKRTGNSPPFMYCVNPKVPGEITTDPTAQRQGSWLIQEVLRERDATEIIGKIIEKEENSGNRTIELLKECLYESITIKSSQELRAKLLQKREKNTQKSNEEDKIEKCIDVIDEERIDKYIDIIDNYIKSEKFKIDQALKRAEDKLKEKPNDSSDSNESKRTESAIKFLGDYKEGKGGFEDLDDMSIDDRKLVEGYLVSAGICKPIRSHDKFFTKKYKEYEIVGLQGCGDLTMNLWNVAYINNHLSEDEPILIHLPDEPLGKRTYSCLIKWRSNEKKYTIEDLKFSHLSLGINKSVFKPKKIQSAAKEEYIDDKIEFAVYGKQIIRNGKIEDLSRITHEFSDLRHLFRLLNLNPNGPLFDQNDQENSAKDPCKEDKRPRSYFGAKQYDHVWFGESQLLRHRNEQRQAYNGPVYLTRVDSNVSIENVEAAAKREGYQKVEDQREPLREGQFRFVDEDDNLIEIYLKHNKYSWSIVGITNDDKVMWMACEADSLNDKGFVLKEAAETLLRSDVKDALLIDEGDDVFQMAQLKFGEVPDTTAAGGSKLAILVPKSKDNNIIPKRTRLRAIFIFAKKKSDS